MHTRNHLFSIILLLLMLISANSVFAQVGEDICRHFIVSIDKYPDSPYRDYMYSSVTVDAAKEILTKKFSITDQDYVSILYYGIGTDAINRDAFVTIPSFKGQSMSWISGGDYVRIWNEYNSNPNDNTDSGRHYSMQRASYPYSYYITSSRKSRLVNQTFLLRITDNKENNWKGAVSEHGAYLGSSNISESQWMAIIDSVEKYYSFEEIKINNRHYDSIYRDYGIYICQVVPKDKPTIRNVLSVEDFNVWQNKTGDSLTFSYYETKDYILERLKVDYRLNTEKQWNSLCDCISSRYGIVKFLIPENLEADSIEFSFKVWGSSKNACGAMVISPFDTITGTGSQLDEIRHLQLKHANILRVIPLSKKWPWFVSNDAELTALIWTIIFVVTAVIALFVIYFILRRYRVTVNNISLEIVSQSLIKVDLLKKTENSEVAAKLLLKLAKPLWSKGRKIKEDVKAKIVLDDNSTANNSVIRVDKDVLSPSQSDICIKDYKTDIQVYVRPDKIRDNQESQTAANVSKEYLLPARFVLKNKRGKKLLDEELEFKVAFDEITHQPEIGIKDELQNQTSILEVTYDNYNAP